VVCDEVDERLLAAHSLPSPWRVFATSSVHPLDAMLDGHRLVGSDVVLCVELEAALSPPQLWTEIDPVVARTQAGLVTAANLPPRVTPLLVNMTVVSMLRRALGSMRPPGSLPQLFACAQAAGLAAAGGLPCGIAEFALPAPVAMGAPPDVRFDSRADIALLQEVIRTAAPSLKTWARARQNEERTLRTVARSVGRQPSARVLRPSNALRVLFVSNPSAFGGAESSTLELVRSLHRRNVETAALVAYEGHWTRALRECGCRVFCSNQTFDEDSLRAWDICTAGISNWAPDVVHDCGSSGTVAAKAAFNAGIPVLHHAHVPTPQRYAASSGWTDRFVAVSESVAAALHAADIDPALVRVVPNGIEASRYDAVRSLRRGSRRQLGIADEAFTVLTLARFSPEKRLADAVDAFALLRSDVADAHLVMAGESHSSASTYAAVLERIRRHGLTQAVHLPGFFADVRPLLAAADALVLCSEYEGLSMVALEAFASRVPLIATPVGGLQEVVGSIDDPAACAIRVDVGSPAQVRDAMLLIRSAVSEVDMMTLRGREIVERRFSSEAMAAAFVDLYSQLRRQRSRP
jgi:glycosyltransferase involved in cell wall biosynthesis